ncbi:MAG: TolC family protein [bacterium]|nr:TolC family protein [bacterium]
MKQLTLFLLSMILVLGISYAGEPLRFDQAIAIALEKNHQVLMARNTAGIAGNNVHIGNADLLPGVSLSTGAVFRDGSAFSESGGTTTTDAGIQVTYTLFDGLGNLYRYRKLQVEGELGELEARDAIESTLLRVAGAFYAAASAYENLQIAQELLSISEERVARARKRSAYGQARTIDVLSAQVDYQADRVTVTQAKFLWDETRRILNVLLGRESGLTFTVDTTVTFGKNLEPRQLTSAALSNNAAYLAAQKQWVRSGYDLRIARSQFLPRLDFSGSYGFSRTAPRLELGLKGADFSLRLGATLSFNLFNGFKTRIAGRNAEIRRENRQLSLAQARLNLEKDVTSAYESYQNSLLVWDLEKKYVEAAALNFKRTRELYGLGQVTTTQFREAQLNLIRSRSSVATAKYEAKVKEIELFRLTGQLLLRED